MRNNVIEEIATVRNTLKASCNPVYRTIPLYVFIDEKTSVFTMIVTNMTFNNCFTSTNRRLNLFSMRIAMKIENKVHPRSSRKISQRGTIFIFFSNLTVRGVWEGIRLVLGLPAEAGFEFSVLGQPFIIDLNQFEARRYKIVRNPARKPPNINDLSLLVFSFSRGNVL